MDPKVQKDRAIDFWASNEEHEFWIICSRDAQMRRFKRFLKATLEAVAKGEMASFGERMKQEAGKMNVFDDFEADYSADARPVPLIYKMHRDDYEIDGKQRLEFPVDSQHDERMTRPVRMEDFEGLVKF